MCLIANDNFKIIGKIGVKADPNAKVSIGGNNHFIINTLDIKVFPGNCFWDTNYKVQSIYFPVPSVHNRFLYQ